MKKFLTSYWFYFKAQWRVITTYWILLGLVILARVGLFSPGRSAFLFLLIIFLYPAFHTIFRKSS